VEEPSVGVQIIGHVSYVFLVSAALVRAILPLRLLAIGAGLTSIWYGLAISSSVEVVWESIFTIINAVQAVILIREKQGIRLTTEETSLQAAVFPHMSRLDFHRLIRAGTWRSDPPGVEFTARGEPVAKIVLMSDGLANVIVDGERIVAHCRRGDFVGEIAFVSGAAATATVRTVTPTRSLVWDFADLRALLDKHPELEAAVQVVFNKNLIGKLNDQRDRRGAETPPPAPSSDRP
jgi:hypothetical protein